MTTAIEKRRSRNLQEREPFQALREEIESLWSQLIGDRGNRWIVPMTLPPLDVSETAATVEVHLDLPGFKPEDINIELSQNILTVSGHREEEKTTDEKTFHRSERRSGKFSRSVTLPASVAEDKVDAQYKDGVLSVILQKTEEAKTRKIQIKT